MSANHEFQALLEWTGAAAGPVSDYDGYSREHRISVPGKPVLAASASPAFRGDGKLHNPEDLLVAALASCHFLSYAALCARHKIQLIAYSDDARGVMAFDKERKVMAFQEVVLRPRVTVAQGSDEGLAMRLHEKAHHECFIANSVNFPVRNEPQTIIQK